MSAPGGADLFGGLPESPPGKPGQAERMGPRGRRPLRGARDGHDRARTGRGSSCPSGAWGPCASWFGEDQQIGGREDGGGFRTSDLAADPGHQVPTRQHAFQSVIRAGLAGTEPG
jgi:hypothetical protein